MNALILAGGFGTRLGEIVKAVPKPMLLVLGRPFLEWIILDLKRKNFDTVIISVFHMADQIINYFGDGSRLGIKIRYSIEARPLGTGGAVLEAMNQIETDNCLVVNGDSYCDYDFKKFSEFYSQKKASVLMGLVKQLDCERYGSVTLTDVGKIISFLEKNETLSIECHNINAGIYLINKGQFLIQVKNMGKVFSLEKDYFPAIIGSNFYGLSISDSFLDIGTPDSYESSERFMAKFNFTKDAKS